MDKQTLSVLSREVRSKGLVIEARPGGGTQTRELTGEEAMRPVLDDSEVVALARLGLTIEQHYGAAQDTEWAFDPDGKLWILQARPVTTGAEAGDSGSGSPPASVGRTLLHGLGAAPGRASGSCRILATLADAERLQAGEVLVTHMTSPDWVPLMRRAAAVVTDTGGMTCHAAIVSRELGIPCIVGTVGATATLRDGELVSVDAGRGLVLEGAVNPAVTTTQPAQHAVAAPVTATQLLVNLSEPSQAERVAQLDVDGVGLLRAEMMVLEALEGRHPRLLLERGQAEMFVERMTAGLTLFASAFAGRPITYRTIDFRSNEFRGLEGESASSHRRPTP